MKWCTSQYMGQKFSPEIWAETLKFLPPEIPLTNPKNFGGAESPPQGRNFHPQRSAYKRRGRGEDTLWSLLPPLTLSLQTAPIIFSSPSPETP
jgi:hypothetical protein